MRCAASCRVCVNVSLLSPLNEAGVSPLWLRLLDTSGGVCDRRDTGAGPFADSRGKAFVLGVRRNLRPKSLLRRDAVENDFVVVVSFSSANRTVLGFRYFGRLFEECRLCRIYFSILTSRGKDNTPSTHAPNTFSEVSIESRNGSD